MNVLLDTHALLWYASNDSQLSETARKTIETEAGQVFASPLIYWELAIKVSLGKLTLARPFQEFVDLCDSWFPTLPITMPHIVHLSGLPYPTAHRDPFDRLLIAQALVEGWPIISRDVAFDAYGVQRIW